MMSVDASTRADETVAEITREAGAALARLRRNRCGHERKRARRRGRSDGGQDYENRLTWS